MGSMPQVVRFQTNRCSLASGIKDDDSMQERKYKGGLIAHSGGTPTQGIFPASELTHFAELEGDPRQNMSRSHSHLQFRSKANHG